VLYTLDQLALFAFTVVKTDAPLALFAFTDVYALFHRFELPPVAYIILDELILPATVNFSPGEANGTGPIPTLPELPLMRKRSAEPTVTIMSEVPGPLYIPDAEPPHCIG